MADWVHCNQCYCQPTHQRKFFLSSCGHIFCDDCDREGAKTKCLICGMSRTTIVLCAKMKPEVDIFFQDPLEIIKNHQKQLIQVMEFQRNHSRRLAAHKKQQEAKMLSQMDITKRQLDGALDLEREIRRSQEENNRLRRLLSGSPGPGGAAKCSYRPGTPGGVLANSSIPPSVRNIVYQNSSQSMSRSSSPYNRLQQVEASKVQQSQPMTPTRTPPGPARYSIRTPPVNGRIGTCNTPTMNMTLTPSGTLIRSANTPGGLAEMATPRSSPMNVSPASSRRGYLSLGNLKSTPYGDCLSQGSMSSLLSQSSQSDPGRRNSQQNQMAKRSPLSGTPCSQHRLVKS